MADLESIVSNEEFSVTIKKNRQVRPIWILLVDGGPYENPKHMKNIIQYAHLFRSLDLDYLTVHTYASGQSAYNPVGLPDLLEWSFEDWTSRTFWNSSWKVEPPFWKGRTFRFSGTALEWLLKERGNVFLLMGHNTPNPILGWTFRSSGMTLERLLKKEENVFLLMGA
ncbi:hypothetical protein RhiirA4_449129 [Rhizophagus irregularis]|uniref:Uncharacterized protein n=1 Tax=Rhizophagus irregularis TaxID=588596 RepID=A0A2I1HG22_9GLOM|nr:hypothetical protein RhiirA4_449129 [Rhizophagus irregularis]